MKTPNARSIATGATFGIWLWCIVDLFRILPSALNGSAGLFIVAAACGGLHAMGCRRLVVGAVLGWTALFVVVAVTPLAHMINGRWVRTERAGARPVGAVVVLSSGITTDSTINDDALDRLIAGIELARQQPGALLVTTLAQLPTSDPPISSEPDQTRIVRMLDGTVDWIETPLARTTHEEALRSRDVLGPRGIRRIAVVTAPMHTRRACATFEAVGFEVVCVAARRRRFSAFSLDSPGDRVEAFGAWIYELLGMVKYGSRGWLTRPG